VSGVLSPVAAAIPIQAARHQGGAVAGQVGAGSAKSSAGNGHAHVKESYARCAVEPSPPPSLAATQETPAPVHSVVSRRRRRYSMRDELFAGNTGSC